MTIESAQSALELRSVSVSFPGRRNWRGSVVEYVQALREVSLTLPKGSSLGLIGESGSGKTTLAKVILGLQRPDSGEVFIAGTELVSNSLTARRERARTCQIVFQDPRTSLDPRFRIWELMTEGLEIRESSSRAGRFGAASTIAEQVGIAKTSLRRYPHELSGGQRQRVAIGRALSMEPELLILDEPTSALDVTIQAQVLNILLQLQVERGLSYLFISHDVSVVEHMCDDIAVLYRGRIEETGKTVDVLSQPKSEYTKALISAVPRLPTQGARA